MADSRTRRKTPSRSRSSSRSRSHIRPPSSVDSDDIEVVLESKKKPTDRGNIFTQKNAKHALNALGMASQPATTAYKALDKMYNRYYHSRIKRGTRINQVDPAQGHATEIPKAYQILNTERGGKKKRKTQRKRKTRKNKK